MAMLRHDKAGRNGPLELISSSSGPLRQQVFETLPKCYPLVNFAHFNIILIPKHISIPKATRLRSATIPLRVCTLDFLLTIPLNVKRENFTPIVSYVWLRSLKLHLKGRKDIKIAREIGDFGRRR